MRSVLLILLFSFIAAARQGTYGLRPTGPSDDLSTTAPFVWRHLVGQKAVIDKRDKQVVKKVKQTGVTRDTTQDLTFVLRSCPS